MNGGLSNEVLGALVFFAGLFLAAISGARARRQAERVGIDGDSEGGQLVQRLYVAMFLLLSMAGALFGLGVIGPADDEDASTRDTGSESPDWSTTLRGMLPAGGATAPEVTMVVAGHARTLPLEHFRLHDSDCRVQWAVVTLTPGRTWLGSEPLPQGSVRNDLDPVLYDHLLELAFAWKDAAHHQPCNAHPAPPFRGELLLRVDPSVPPEQLRVALFTAGQSQWGNFMVQVLADGARPLPDGSPTRMTPPWDHTDSSVFLAAVAANGRSMVSPRRDVADAPWPDMEPLPSASPDVGEPPAEVPPLEALPDDVSVVHLTLPTVGPGDAPPTLQGFVLSNGVALGTASRREMAQQLVSIGDALSACVDRPTWSATIKYTVGPDGAFQHAAFQANDLPDEARACQLELVSSLAVSPPLGRGMTIVRVTMTQHGL